MWIDISITNLKDKISEDEYEAVTTASLPSGRTGAEIVAEEIERTANFVRGYCPGERGEGTTIPDELLDAALFILRHKVFTRLPGMKALLDELRVSEYNTALTTLKDTSAGRFRITPPTAPAPGEEQATTDLIETVSAPTRQNTRAKLEGLY